MTTSLATGRKPIVPTIHGVGVTIAEETADYTRWEQELTAAVATGNSAAWDVARLYAESDRHPGWSERAQEITGLAASTLMQYAAAWRRWGSTSARAEFPIGHARRVATLDDKAALALLNRHLSQDQMEAEVKKVQQIAGLNSTQLSKVDAVVAATRTGALEYAQQTGRHMPAAAVDELIAEARSEVISDIRAGTPLAEITPKAYAPLILQDGTEGARNRVLIEAIQTAIRLIAFRRTESGEAPSKEVADQLTRIIEVASSWLDQS